MPNHVEGGRRILEFIAEERNTATYVNRMAQYRPAYKARTEDAYGALARPITAEEYAELLEYGRNLNLTQLEVDPRATGGLM